ncbi:MAG: hypothetical protein KAU20_03465 [Nanoarchaeota archaeon]|nr:hypothetical protein [Nanoarchaeota archaeon]
MDLVSAYYSVPENRTFCVYEVSSGKFTAAELKGKGWKPIKEKSKLLIKLNPDILAVEYALKNWLRINVPAAQKLNYVKKSLPFPDIEKVKTKLKPLRFEQ